MHLSLVLIALAAHLAIIARVMACQPRDGHGRFHVAWLAWVIVAISGGSAIELLLHPAPVGFFTAVRDVLLAVFVYVARGNVGLLLRGNEA